MNTLSSRWVPRINTPDRKHECEGTSKECLNSLIWNRANFRRLLVTVNETWINHGTEWVPGNGLKLARVFRSCRVRMGRRGYGLGFLELPWHTLRTSKKEKPSTASTTVHYWSDWRPKSVPKYSSTIFARFVSVWLSHCK